MSLSVDLIMYITEFNLKIALCTVVCIVYVNLFYEINFIIFIIMFVFVRLR